MPVEKERVFGYWRDPLFLICLATYVVNRELIKPNLHHYSPLFHGHLNDTLTVPVVLPIFLLFYRWIKLRPDDQMPRSWEVAPHVLVWVLFFEWFGPLTIKQGVYDPIDMWCELGGGIAAWLFWQRAWLMNLVKPRNEARP